DYVAPTSAEIIDTLARSGAILFGKANLHELAAGGTSSNPTFGAVGNPYDPSRIPGGSSGGTAAALAARIVPLGLGEDTGGSIRIPAGFCGICGLRPSTWPRKRYSDDGLVPPPASDDTQTIGPMARTVADLELLDAVITAREPVVARTAAVGAASMNGVRIGVPRDDFWDDEAIDVDVGATVRSAFERLRSAGAVLVPIDVRDIVETGDRLLEVVEIGDSSRFDAWLKRSVQGLTWTELVTRIASRDVKAYYSESRRTEPRLPRAERVARRERATRDYARLLRAAAVSAIAFPQPLLPAPPIHPGGDPEQRQVAVNGKRMSLHSLAIRFSVFGARLGVPGLVLPAGLTHGLPVGIELEGPPGGDEPLLALGMKVEAALGPLPPPALASR
ncbi:MAG: amidase family protein, partial [Acetobacteraceae bacterium]